jgi:cephalosporin-C deacetylase
MAQFDMPLAQLNEYRPDVECPPDFVEFWTRSVAQARQAGAANVATITEVATGLNAVTAYDVTFAGFAGDPIKAWLIVPKDSSIGDSAQGSSGEGSAQGSGLPVIVQMIAYGGGRGLPHEHLKWANAGFAHLVVDVRGQGGHWGAGGETADPHGRSAGVGGWLTSGIERPEDHFYRRYYIDGVRAVDFVRQTPGLDGARIALEGTSQAGGGVIAAGSILSMLGEPVQAVMPNVPFLSNFRRAVQIIDSRPYGEITQLLSVRRNPAFEEIVWNTLSYIDAVNFARFATSPTLFSVGLMDVTCPPSTVFAAYNYWGAALVEAGGEMPVKEMDVYPYNNHEGGQEYRFPAELAFARGQLG